MRGPSITRLVQGAAVLAVLGSVIAFGQEGDQNARNVLFALVPLAVGAYIHHEGARASSNSVTTAMAIRETERHPLASEPPAQ